MLASFHSLQPLIISPCQDWRQVCPTTLGIPLTCSMCVVSRAFSLSCVKYLPAFASVISHVMPYIWYLEPTLWWHGNAFHSIYFLFFHILGCGTPSVICHRIGFCCSVSVFFCTLGHSPPFPPRWYSLRTPSVVVLPGWVLHALIAATCSSISNVICALWVAIWSSNLVFPSTHNCDIHPLDSHVSLPLLSALSFPLLPPHCLHDDSLVALLGPSPRTALAS